MPQSSTVEQTPSLTMEASTSVRKSLAFWMTFLSLCLSLSLYALELTSISTALPTIVEDLNVSDFVWVGASYTLASMAGIPLTGNAAQVFGRKPTLVSAVLLFAVGSALCGAARNAAMLLAGRTVQGLGGGAIVTMGDILLGDLIPLKERGTYYGILGLTWSIACSIGPVVGGALASAGAWRWLFYLNLPICGLCLFVLMSFLRLRTPRERFSNKLKKLDYIGNILSMGAATAIAVALAWGGVQFSWSSDRVLVPLVVGVIGLIFFVIFEKLGPKEPILPYILLSNRTTMSGYIQSIISAVVALAATYFIPVYYQACKGSTAIKSGVETLGFAVIAPSCIIAGVLVATSQKYRPWLWIGWILMIVGSALMTTVKTTTALGQVVGFTAIVGFGVGWVYAAVQFPIQAPLPVGLNAQSMSLLAFTRAFGSIWGVSIGNTILQNVLQRQLPQEFFQKFADGVPIVYALIPTVKELPEPLKDQVRLSFANGLKLLWQVLTGISSFGLLSALLMSEVPMIGVVDEKWTMTDDEDRKTAVSSFKV